MKKSDILLIGFIVLFGVALWIFVYKAKAPENRTGFLSGTPTPYTARPTATAGSGAVSAPLGQAPTKAIPTITPTPTINPRLLIRYSREVAQNGKVYEECLIKGNINSKGEKIYHVPGSSSYDSTKIDTKAGERWFCTEYDAIRAGWHAPGQ